jgi:tRNA nucleotidyltransferase (CCA-adding enzyme)
MDLITTHINADFDALSSMVAAGKLYPGARLLLPGSQEKSVRNFLALIKDRIRIEEEKTCIYDDISRIIIVDNRHSSRIGEAAKLLDKKGIKVHIYDHHPRTKTDIKGNKDVFKKVGATVTIILEILAKKGLLKLTPLEATLMLLGIYEETGSLSYSMTTKNDVDMVGRLLGMGAKLNAVSSYLNRELSHEELSAFMRLVNSLEIIDVNGINVAFAHADTDHFRGELGTIVHKFQEVENYPLIFVMFKEGARIRLIARSRVDFIDVNKLLSKFSGAGHSSAASARIADAAYGSLKKEITEILRDIALPEVYASEIMSFPVFTIMGDEKVCDVIKKLEESGYKGAPVLNIDNELIGIVTTGNLKKALKSGMPHAKVRGYITTPVITVSPNTALHDLKKMLTDKNKGRLPVIRDNKLVGIVTRTDVLKKVHSSLFPPESSGHVKVINFRDKMKNSLPSGLFEMVRIIGNTADNSGVNGFLVGGFVRDLILGEPNYDLDIVVEGSAIDFAKVLAAELEGSLVIYERFGTAKIIKNWPSWLGASHQVDNKFIIDVATARREQYKRPGALPTVKFSSLKEDLYRRDFTINAMAIALNEKNFGLFIDFFCGIKDLEKGVIRILHDKSFIDDPTRIFRAVRFEQRFGFSIDKHSEYLIQHAVREEMFEWTENQRIKEELISILKEKYPEKAVLRMRGLHELRFIHPGLTLRRDIKNIFKRKTGFLKWYNNLSIKEGGNPEYWLMNFMLMLDKLDIAKMEEVLKKFTFTRNESMKLREYASVSKTVIKKFSGTRRLKAGQVYDILYGLSPETLICIMSRTSIKTVHRRIKLFMREYSGVKIKVTGKDLKNLGVSPGPEFNRIMRKVLHARLEKKILTKKDEIRFIKNLLSSNR